jgi:hypothetical protein
LTNEVHNDGFSSINDLDKDELEIYLNSEKIYSIDKWKRQWLSSAWLKNRNDDSKSAVPRDRTFSYMEIRDYLSHQSSRPNKSHLHLDRLSLHILAFYIPKTGKASVTLSEKDIRLLREFLRWPDRVWDIEPKSKRYKLLSKKENPDFSAPLVFTISRAARQSLHDYSKRPI